MTDVLPESSGHASKFEGKLADMSEPADSKVPEVHFEESLKSDLKSALNQYNASATIKEINIEDELDDEFSSLDASFTEDVTLISDERAQHNHHHHHGQEHSSFEIRSAYMRHLRLAIDDGEKMMNQLGYFENDRDAAKQAERQAVRERDEAIRERGWARTRIEKLEKERDYLKVERTKLIQLNNDVTIEKEKITKKYEITYKELKSATDECNRLTARINELEKYKLELQRTLSERTIERDEFRSRISGVENRLKERNEEYDELKLTYEELVIVNRKVQNEFELAKEEILKIKRTQYALRDQVRHLEDKLRELNIELNINLEQLQTCKTELKKVRSDCDYWRCQVGEITKKWEEEVLKRERHEITYKKIEEECKELHKEVNELKHELHSKKKYLETVIHDRDEYKRRMEAAEHSVDCKDKMLHELRGEYECLEKKEHELITTIHNMEIGNAEKQKELDRTFHELTIRQGQLDHERRKLKEALAKENETRTSLNKAEQALAAEVAKYNGAEKKLSELQRKYEDQQLELQMALERVRKLFAEVKEAESKEKAAEKKLTEAEAKLKDAEAEVAKAQNNLQAIETQLAASESSLQNAKKSLADAEAQLEAAEKQKAQVEADIVVAKEEAELAKKDADQAKKDAEHATTQAKEEAVRAEKAAELAKKDVEQARKDAEQAKQEAEQVKKAAEQAKKEAEQAKTESKRYFVPEQGLEKDGIWIAEVVWGSKRILYGEDKGTYQRLLDYAKTKGKFNVDLKLVGHIDEDKHQLKDLLVVYRLKPDQRMRFLTSKEGKNVSFPAA